MKAADIWKKIIVLVLILAVPGFLYYLLTSKGKNRYKPLQYFGPKVVAKTSHIVKGKLIPDTIYHSIGNFNLIDQDGKTINSGTFDNKIFIVDFFYTNCPTVCNLMSRNIDSLLSEFGKNKMVYFVSITVDPKRDTPGLLKKYKESFSGSPKWEFLTGDTSSIYNLARNGFLVNALQTAPDNFIYSEKFILIDQQKHIRGYYTGASTTEAARLSDEIKVLIAEELRKNDTPLY